MAQERDTRPLGEIHFAADLPDYSLERASIETKIRDFLHRIGVGVGQDIIDLGCTGLVHALANLAAGEDEPCSPEECTKRALDVAGFIRRNMAGSICGLPCYVPRDRYCLVHDTIGGLQREGNFDGPQAQRYPEALPFMSRELTEEEQRKVSGITAKLSAEARAAALSEYGATDIEDEPAAPAAPTCPIPQPPFKCPEHTEPVWTCRKCIAQAIAEGTQSPVPHDIVGYGSTEEALMSIDSGLARLAEGDLNCVELWVRVASWSKKVARD